MIVWDYDGALGQVNATFPYRFDESKLIQEYENVELILDLAARHDLTMTFACTGFMAEPGHYPFHVPAQIQRIYVAGHEIASHAWRHEWLPFLTRDQLQATLARSKMILESCIGQPGMVKGFVPPFNRPMSWYRKGAVSLGDRVFGPWYPGGNLGSLLPLVHTAGYDWCRVVYRPFWHRWKRGRGVRPSDRSFGYYRKVHCVPHHYTGFDDTAQLYLRQAIEAEYPLVIVGHPSGLSRKKSEHLSFLQEFMDVLVRYRAEGKAFDCTVSDYLTRIKRTEEIS